MHDVRTFDRLARLYDLAMWPADPGAIERALDAAERPVERVVDVGGGTGRVARALDREVLVVDAAPGMVRRAAAHGPAVVGDASRLPLRDGAADAVLVVDALHHFPDAAAAVDEAARALASGGVLAVRDFDPTTLRGRGLVLAERLVGFDSTFRSADDLAELFADAGLDARVLERGFATTVVGVAR